MKITDLRYVGLITLHINEISMQFIKRPSHSKPGTGNGGRKWTLGEWEFANLCSSSIWIKLLCFIFLKKTNQCMQYTCSMCVLCTICGWCIVSGMPHCTRLNEPCGVWVPYIPPLLKAMRVLGLEILSGWGMLVLCKGRWVEEGICKLKFTLGREA